MRPRADVAGAHARTDPQHYQRGAGADRCTPPDVVLAMLRLLDVPQGGRVLEVGTGSGFAAAVLSRAVGPDGHVHSVELDPVTAERARDLLARDGRTNVAVSVGDGLRAVPTGEPVDRLVAFVSVSAEVPAPWVGAVRPGGLLVVPLRDEARVVRFRLGPDGTPAPERAIGAVYADPGA
ncbi:methyltransferase domain-containing protein [Actinomycetospora sp. OC33-EN08]|uniref:Protein-L-isoaspartate O-methyltransferase n=1 Tax=Actinomycetospora aurantiaca TaxID=3129233 RepID=A0ABU8MS85_9PSEU